ncbi:MAG TPA: DUF368 domain-containing protein, partial [Bacteroidetes bacterium]|nr:DUF368 domain-containing protein [Bacteroidota bacterium]
AFKNFHQQTLVVLTGFMIGSLYKIWPWRLPVEYLNKEDGIVYKGLDKFGQINHENIKIISEKLVLPKDYTINDPNTLIVVISMIIGFILVLLLDRSNKSQD